MTDRSDVVEFLATLDKNGLDQVIAESRDIPTRTGRDAGTKEADRRYGKATR